MKDTLRDTLKNKRSKLSVEVQSSKSAKIVENVLNSEAFNNATKIGFYHAVRGEADPSALNSLQLSPGSKKRFYLPVLSANKNQGFLFAEVTPKTQFKNNLFNIPEPFLSGDELVKGETLDLVVVPLLGFDNKGNRLGMGGGYYDRSFAFKKSAKTKPLLMGFAYDFQEVDSLNPEPWDVGLDMIATESHLIDLT